MWWEASNAWFDCYELLGINQDAKLEEIKKAYRTLAKKYHPDNKDGDIEIFRKVELAYQTLSDDDMRASYDEFTKMREEKKENHKEEHTVTFEELVKTFKDTELQIKLSIGAMIKKVEKKEAKFSSIYNDFCEAIKNGTINEHEFEVRKQKLRSIELSSINSIKEVEDILETNLSNIALDLEKASLNNLKKKFKTYDKLLTSSFRKAIRILNNKEPDEEKKENKRLAIFAYSPAITFMVITLSFLLYTSHVLLQDINRVEKGEDLDKEIELEADIELTETPEVEETPEPTDEVATDELSLNCPLFQPLPEDLELVEYSEPYLCMGCFYEVINAKDEFGANYHLDAETGELLFGPYISHGGTYYDSDHKEHYLVVLGIDGYDYYIDADLAKKRVIDVENIYKDESEPYYLEGYGYVIEAYNCGEKYLIDAKTRYPLFRNFDDYSEMYYDEEFGCDVYCFSKFDGESKYYVAANDLRKVLKIENSWENE